MHTITRSFDTRTNERRLLVVGFATLFLLGLPAITFADVTENFDSYTTGSAINGQNGGSGWSGSWVSSVSGSGSGSITTPSAPTGGQGGNTLLLSGSGSGLSAVRAFSPIATGTLSLLAQVDNYPPNGEDVRFDLSDTTGPRGVVVIYFRDSNIEAYNPATANWVSFVSNYATSTWYRINVRFGSGMYAVSINNGAYSADIPYQNPGDKPNSFGSVIDEPSSNPHMLYIDDISITIATSTPTPTPITGFGTTNRLAKFTASTTIGDALLSDDGANTTLTSGNLFLQIGSIIDTVVSGVLNIGTTIANAITIGRVGITTTIPGILSIGSLTTTSNCSSTASPAVCGSAPAGSVAMATGGTTLVVNTSAVTANSQIFVMEDSSLGSRLGITCSTTGTRTYTINARTAGTSFTIKSSNPPVMNKACLSYWIVN